MLLDRGLTLEQLDLAYDIAVADPDPKTNRKKLTVALRDLVSEQEAEGKTKKCLTRIWLNPPPEAELMIQWARKQDIAREDRATLHLGALLATFPFVGAVARSLGAHLQTEGRIAASALRAEVRRTLGDRTSVDVAARKAYTTLRHLGFVDQVDQELVGVDVPDVSPPLMGWLAHSVMLTRQAESITTSSVMAAPELLGLTPRWSQRAYPLLEGHAEADGVVLVEREAPPRVELVVLGRDDERVSQVLALWRTQRQWLGFLPTEGFLERAAKGTLLVAVVGTKVVGYVLYDLPGDRVKLIHLCIADQHRGRGIARQLVDEVSMRHRERRGIELRCRRDYPANAAWPDLGFVARQEAPGRSEAGHPLTHWFRDHGHPDLFTLKPGADPDEPLAAALDHNIVIDLLSERGEGAESLHLEDPWLSEYITLCITDEVDQEIDKCDDPAQRQRMRQGITRFRRLAAPFNAEVDSWNDFEAVIEDAAPKADPADHRHLARAAAGGATFFVTRDGELNDAAPRILESIGVQVMRPEELITYIDRMRAEERYEPSALHATPFEIARAADHDAAFVPTFLNYGDGERKAGLESTLRSALASPADHEALVVRAGSGGLLGGVVRTVDKEAIRVQVMRVRGADRLSYAVARQLAFLQREKAATAGIPVVEVNDPHPSQPVRYALAEEGYAWDGSMWRCHVDAGVRRLEDLDIDGVLEGRSETAGAAAAEHERWPVRIVGAGVPTFVVPIRPQWAEQLFDSNLAAGTLFGRDAGLGLSREHVYYRRPRNSGGVAPPARLLWYVSGRWNGQSEGSIRAVSNLAEVVEDRPLTVYGRFERLGVYSEAQVMEAADDRGLVMAMRFIDTELFEKPITLSRIREMAARNGDTFVAPMSPRRTDEELFIDIYQEASGYAR
jgi:GNAT superfamily N-acetyltransferase